MSDGKRKILALVEGERIDVRLMQQLFEIYRIDVRYEIVSYRTNIYTLYREMFAENDPETFSLLQVLKEKEPDVERKPIFDDAYTDVLLIFDLDPQAPDYTPEKICRMAAYFVESSDMGKLYINYPMVEAFYHMASIPDSCFDSYYASLMELAAGQYKSRVNRVNRNHDYSKFAVTREECDIVIRQNLSKAWRLLNATPDEGVPLEQLKVLAAQLGRLRDEARVAVLNTCVFFIPEYDPKLISR